MANIKSSQKKNRQRIKHEARNQARKSAMRTAVKRVRTAIGKKDASGAATLLWARPSRSSIARPRAGRSRAEPRRVRCRV